jgi:predicted nucleotidyltransferase component of viral defense system
MNAKTYKTANAFRAALEARLSSQAGSGGMSLDRLRQQAGFDRFLARLFQEEDPYYLVKGGYAMELRLHHRARFSRDLDLSAKEEKGMGDPQAIRAKLQTLLSKDLGDWFVFRVAEAGMKLDVAPCVGYRYAVDARLADRTFNKFHIDVVAGDAILDDPLWAQGSSLFDFAGIPRSRVALVPAETHFAEKIHAYTRPRSRTNSRVRDLIDLMLLLDEGFNALETVRRALVSTFPRRSTHPLPRELQDPDLSWTKDYADIALEIQLASYPSVQDAYARLSAFWKELFPKGVS